MGRHRNANIFVYLWMTAYSFHQHYIPDCVRVCNAFHVDECHLYTADTHVTMYRNIARFFVVFQCYLLFYPTICKMCSYFVKASSFFMFWGVVFFVCLLNVSGRNVCFWELVRLVKHCYMLWKRPYQNSQSKLIYIYIYRACRDPSEMVT